MEKILYGQYASFASLLTAGSYPKPDESTPQTHTRFLYDYFQNYSFVTDVLFP
jgi:hypothetical protein